MSDAAVFLSSALRAQDAAVGDALPRVAADADEEALHDLRVAIRRLRVLLRVARPVYTRFYVEAVREPLTAFHRATSALRDEEVLEETLAAVRLKSEAFDAFKRARRRRERRLRREVRDRIARGELEAARRKLAALLELPVRPKRRRELATFARECVYRAQKAVEKLRDAPVREVDALHELRIAYKNLRYVVECFAEVLPPDLAALAEPAKRLQTRLGELHDADVALATVRDARALPPDVRARVLRSLARVRAKRARAYVALAGPAQPAPP